MTKKKHTIWNFIYTVQMVKFKIWKHCMNYSRACDFCVFGNLKNFLQIWRKWNVLREPKGFTGTSVAKNPLVNEGDMVWSLVGPTPGGGNGNPLQYSCLKSSWIEEPGGRMHISDNCWSLCAREPMICSKKNCRKERPVRRAWRAASCPHNLRQQQRPNTATDKEANEVVCIESPKCKIGILNLDG